MDLGVLIESLSIPAAYPYLVDSVEVRQTHISAVFLAGPYVYKIKKPVSPGFLDFSTLEKRLYFCQEEVRLNRRLAPHVYLGVVPVVQSSTGAQFEGQGEPIEWAVKMQRLPDSATLQASLQRGAVGIALVENLAARIATFHRAADANPHAAEWGRFESVRRLVLDIFGQASRQVGKTVSQAVYDRTQVLAEGALSEFHALIDERAARGMTRNCHGDLHLDHVYLFAENEPPADLVIIDCIEFNERLRFMDPIADMSFPAMDFAFYGRRDLARVFADAYFRVSNDQEGRLLLPLYTAYRATVRGAVEGLLLAEKEVSESDRAIAHTKARAHWLLALAELEKPGQKPCLLLVAGLPGTGKSTMARGLAEVAGFCVIRSDEVRKQLAGIPAHLKTPAEARLSLYTPEWNARTYSECMRRAELLLWEGRRVIVDATFREQAERTAFQEMAVRWGVPAGLLICQAEPETVRSRLAQRRGDLSDADWSVYVQIAQKWEDVIAFPQCPFRVIPAEGSAKQVLDRALEALERLGLK
jgi:aminoglycoside phosphotransferase family enzyme/predicted kinase